MARSTGTYEPSSVAGEGVKAFVPHALPPNEPRLRLTGKLAGPVAVMVGVSGISGSLAMFESIQAARETT